MKILYPTYLIFDIVEKGKQYFKVPSIALWGQDITAYAEFYNTNLIVLLI